MSEIRQDKSLQSLITELGQSVLKFAETFNDGPTYPDIDCELEFDRLFERLALCEEINENGWEAMKEVRLGHNDSGCDTLEKYRIVLANSGERSVCLDKQKLGGLIEGAFDSIKSEISSLYTEISCQHSELMRDPSDEYGSRCYDEKFGEKCNEEEKKLVGAVELIRDIALLLLHKESEQIEKKAIENNQLEQSE